MLNKLSLSNRTLGVLIILGFILTGYLFYSYYFVYNLTVLKIDSNVSDYKVTLSSIKVPEPIVRECEEKICIIEDLAQFEYGVNVEKEDYKNFSKNIDLSVSNNINVKLVKDTRLELIEESEVEVIEEVEFKKEEKSKEEVFKEIKKQKQLKDSYLVLNLEGYGDFIFIENGASLDLYNSGIKLGTFDKQDRSDIEFQKIVGNTDYIYLKNGTKNYFVNITIDKVVEFSFGVDIDYLKQSDIGNQIQIITEKGTFIYSFKTGEVNYFSLFFDFIFDGEVYVALIKSDDKIRKNNYGFSNNTGNLIVSYNPKTKEKALLKSFDFEYKKLEINGDQLILSSDSGEKYNIKNY